MEERISTLEKSMEVVISDLKGLGTITSDLLRGIQQITESMNILHKRTESIIESSNNNTDHYDKEINSLYSLASQTATSIQGITNDSLTTLMDKIIDLSERVLALESKGV